MLGYTERQAEVEAELNRPDTKPESDGTQQEQIPGDVKPPVQADGQGAIPPEEKPPVESSESLKDVLTQVLAEQRAAPAAAPAAQTQPEQPYYTPTVPMELINAVSSEDPNVRQQGVSIIIGGAMNKVRADLSAVIRAEVQAALNVVPNLMQYQQKQKEDGDNLRKTFYEEHPNFGGNPNRMKLVAMTAIELAQGMGKEFKGPDKAFRDKLAATVEGMTGIKSGKAASPKDPPPKPRYQSGGSPARGDDGAPSLSQEIWDTIGGGLN